MDNNKKEVYIKFNKKVVSISFLALALFMLLAVSYAYFTATVTGNEDAKKTTLTTGKMSLVFDGEDIIETKDNMVPGESVELKFSVLNNGNVATTYNIDMIDVENNFNPTSDLVYTVTSNNNGGSKSETIAPSQSETLIRNILIQPGEDNIQEYVLKLEFKETHSNQNSNQEKTFKGKVQINKLTDDSIATTILRNMPIQTTEPDFDKPSPLLKCEGFREVYDSSCLSNKFTEEDNGNGLFAAPDNDGTSYYFRGKVDNNNVKFANKNWKILRINGDGTIRLILKDIGGPEKSRYGATNLNSPGSYEASEIKKVLDQWYNDTLVNFDDKISLTTYCNDTSINCYADDYMVPCGFGDEKISLVCPAPTDYQSTQTHNYGGALKLKIGTLNYDEAIMSGMSMYSAMYDGYEVGDNYLKSLLDNSSKFYTMSPVYYSMSPAHLGVYYISNAVIYKGDYEYDGSEVLNVIPVINLNANVKFTGSGTTADPYTINS